MTTRETQHPNTDDNTQGFGRSLGNWDLVMLGSLEELVKVFNTNIETGLTDDQVQERRGPKWKLGEYSQDHDGRRMKNVVLVRRNGTVVEVSPVDLVYGDIVEVKVKHPVPMGWWDNTGEYNDDYFGERIIESDGFQVQSQNQEYSDSDCIPTISEVDQSGLNGDSSAKEKGPGISEGNPLEATNLAFYHCRAISGWCVGLVYCTGEEKEKYIFKP